MRCLAPDDDGGESYCAKVRSGERERDRERERVMGGGRDCETRSIVNKRMCDVFIYINIINNYIIIMKDKKAKKHNTAVTLYYYIYLYRARDLRAKIK